jgi:uncharacterized protein
VERFANTPFEVLGSSVRFKEFKRMRKVTLQNKNEQNITISAVINFPQGFEEGKKYPAVVAVHAGGAVKEQTAGLYARKLAE